MTTRRAFLVGATSTLAAPALVGASPLSAELQHEYFAYADHSGVYDIVRRDGLVVGWLDRIDIKLMSDKSPDGILERAADGFTEECRKLATNRLTTDNLEPPIALEELSHLI